MSIETKRNAALQEICKFHQLSDAQIKNLENFVSLLLTENQQFNFIGRSTIDEIWDRHILDSAQLLRCIENKNLKFADLGAGAGFPGFVLSILGLQEVHLIEKSYRKCEFLRLAKMQTDFPASQKIFVRQAKLEELPVIEFNYIVSRALAPLDRLLFYSQKFLKKGGYCCFLKGKNLNKEIQLAKEKFKFDYELTPSLTSSEGSIIKIFNLQ